MPGRKLIPFASAGPPGYYNNIFYSKLPCSDYCKKLRIQSTIGPWSFPYKRTAAAETWWPIASRTMLTLSTIGFETTKSDTVYCSCSKERHSKTPTGLFRLLVSRLNRCRLLIKYDENRALHWAWSSQDTFPNYNTSDCFTPSSNITCSLTWRSSMIDCGGAFGRSLLGRIPLRISVDLWRHACHIKYPQPKSIIFP